MLTRHCLNSKVTICWLLVSYKLWNNILILFIFHFQTCGGFFYLNQFEKKENVHASTTHFPLALAKGYIVYHTINYIKLPWLEHRNNLSFSYVWKSSLRNLYVFISPFIVMRVFIPQST